MSSLVLKVYPTQVSLLGLGGAFICNAVCCFLAAAFVLRWERGRKTIRMLIELGYVRTYNSFSFFLSSGSFPRHKVSH